MTQGLSPGEGVSGKVVREKPGDSPMPSSTAILPGAVKAGRARILLDLLASPRSRSTLLPLKALGIRSEPNHELRRIQQIRSGLVKSTVQSRAMIDPKHPGSPPPTGEDPEDPDDPTNVPSPGSTVTFGDLGLPQRVLARLDELGFVTPTPIQEGSIPIINEGGDLIGKAETGTGKTLAFTAPVMSQLDPERVTVQALVLCPTRELAQQVEEVASQLGEGTGIRTALLVGGVHQAGQILALRRGAHFAVGTPGRVLDFLQQGVLRLGYARHVVLDEADRMLDMGFIDEVSAILERTPNDRQTLLFSATIPPRIRSLMKRFMHHPETVSTTKALATVPNIHQRFARVGKHDKERFFLELLDRTPGETCIVFCNTRRAVIELDRTLWGRGYPAGSLHGDHDQDRRFKVLDGFKAKKITTLVATDVAARGLDVEAVHRVVNYDVPDEVETYVHRIGRTGRASETGESITLVSPLEKRSWEKIVSSTQFEVEEIPFKGTRPPPRHEQGHHRGRRGRPSHSKPKDRRSSQRSSTRRSGSRRSPSGSSSGDESPDRRRRPDRERTSNPDQRNRQSEDYSSNKSRGGETRRDSEPRRSAKENRGASEESPRRSRRRRRRPPPPS